MNIPTNPELEPIPDQAKGNPVYEQTRQDMPLWCCGRNCGRNSRLRNDTFYDKDKQHPKPFEYATEANVGLFRYEILEVYEYPWPPEEQRDLFDAIHERELERLAAVDRKVDGTYNDQNANDDGKKEQEQHGFVSIATSNTAAWFVNRLLPNKFPDDFYDDDFTSSKPMDDDNENDDDDDVSNPSQNNITQHQNDTTSIILTKAPSDTPPPRDDIPVSDVPDVLPGSNAILRLPTTSPTPSPTRTDPNDLINVEVGVVKPYPIGVEFDSLFTNGQKGAMWAPILATTGLAFSLVEFCCCTYKCSWLPTALCLYGAFMLQLMTMFLFMTEDFCKYDQDCALGFSGLLSAVAVIAYMISQMLVCMTPRPPPLYNLCKKPPIKRKKKKKKKKTPDEFDEKWGLVDDDDDNYNNNNEDGFVDEPNGYVDPYDDDNDYQEEPHHTSNDEYNDYNDYEYDDNHRSDNQESYGEGADEYEDEDNNDNDYQDTIGIDKRSK